MKKILLAAALILCTLGASAEEGDWGVGAAFGYASKLMKFAGSTINQECNQISVFLDRDINDKFGATAEFDLYIPYKMKGGDPYGLNESRAPEVNLFLAPYLMAGDDFHIGLAAGPVFSYSKADYLGPKKGLFYLDLGLKVWIGYNFSDEWGIFVNSRFEWDLYSNGYYDLVPSGGSFRFGGFNASLGVRYSF